MCERVKLTPLTPDEQKFADENYPVIQWVQKKHGINDDLLDVAYMGYLHAVKKWFARPELRKWSFPTIVNQTVRSHISGERKKQGRRIQAMSLEAELPGTDGFSYGDIVTYENIRYLSGKEETDMSMKMTYDIVIPAAAKTGRTPSVEVEKLIEFLESAHKTMSFEYSDTKEAASKCGTLRNWKKKSQRSDFEIYKMAGIIYVEKTRIKPSGRKTEK